MTAWMYVLCGRAGVWFPTIRSCGLNSCGGCIDRHQSRYIYMARRCGAVESSVEAETRCGPGGGVGADWLAMAASTVLRIE